MDVLGPVDCPQYCDWDDTKSTDSYASLHYFTKRPKQVRKAAIVVKRASLRDRGGVESTVKGPHVGMISSRAEAMNRTRTAVQGMLRPREPTAPPTPAPPTDNTTPPKAITPQAAMASPQRPSAKVMVPIVQRMSSILRCATPNLKEATQLSKRVCRAVRSITPQAYMQATMWKK